MELIQRLWQERDSLVSDFLERFATISYEGALVPDEDVRQDGGRHHGDVPVPARRAGTARRSSVTSARRGRSPGRARGFRWGLPQRRPQRLSGSSGKDLNGSRGGRAPKPLVANMDRVLDTVESYVTSIQQAFSEEEALLARDKQLHRQRLLSRPVNRRHPNSVTISDIAAGLELARARTSSN